MLEVPYGGARQEGDINKGWTESEEAAENQSEAKNDIITTKMTNKWKYSMKKVTNVDRCFMDYLQP
jgi:hypothetical protein